jgi:hypothetical protein
MKIQLPGCDNRMTATSVASNEISGRKDTDEALRASK